MAFEIVMKIFLISAMVLLPGGASFHNMAARTHVLEAKMTQDDKSAMKWTLGAILTAATLWFVAYAAGWMTMTAPI